MNYFFDSIFFKKRPPFILLYTRKKLGAVHTPLFHGLVKNNKHHQTGVAVKHGTAERGTTEYGQQIRNGKTRKNKSGTVKSWATSLVRYNAYKYIIKFFCILFIHHLNCYQLHTYIIYIFICYISVILYITHLSMQNISQVLIINFLFPCRNLPCAMLISHIMQLLFFIANSPKTSFFCLYYHSCEFYWYFPRINV